MKASEFAKKLNDYLKNNQDFHIEYDHDVCLYSIPIIEKTCAIHKYKVSFLMTSGEHFKYEYENNDAITNIFEEFKEIV
jgi:hypothetical protein